MPFTLLAAILIPIPVPQTKMPRSTSWLTTFSLTVIASPG
ncbi:ribose 5-phosphate isomerase B/allose [Listeria monocytogenes]|nr:ribose 5-phosphate isomerase B/allose [Listeria monocytogenes]